MKSRRKLHAARNARRAGATTVEMAIVGPLLLLFIFGLFDIAHGFMVQHLIQDATRQGCRVGICSRKTNVSVQATIDRLLKAEGITNASTTILVNDAASDVATARAGDNISVQITLASSEVSLFPGTGYLKGRLQATCTMRRE